MTIPRLELLSATIGARLYKNVQSNFTKKFRCFCWSDSPTVLSWIRRNEKWATFVWNRVSEIRSLTSTEDWRHVPGCLNPADLPSRGCSPRQLKESKWWEGPKWLYQEERFWPLEEQFRDEEEINKEKKKTVTTMVTVNYTDEWHLKYFSQYTKTVRMMAWIFRFIYNAKQRICKKDGCLTAEELDVAERFIFRIIQREAFQENDLRLRTLQVFSDDKGVFRLKSCVSNKKDHELYRFPIILPSNHVVIDKLVLETHKKLCHVDPQGMLSHLREKLWILGGRRYIRSIISRCVVCKRHSGKPFQTSVPPLPLDRVRNALAFEVIGVDLAGPLLLKSSQKVWVCLFTCAVYRGVHLELVTSLSTHCFMQAMRRFVARCGRPKIIYSDNGTNFVGTENLVGRLNWQEIMRIASVERITWRFNPPTASWWDGFWERLIGLVKQLLRKTLGRASLHYEDLLTLICDCEAIINSRPLTYLTNDVSELIPLTPDMFIKDQIEIGLPDFDSVDRTMMCKKVARIQKIREDMRRRFRSEYLGKLHAFARSKPTRGITVDEIVLDGNDNEKRLNWPIGRVSELLPGRDGTVRLARVITERGQFLRPVQRIFPLEVIELDNARPSLGKLESTTQARGKLYGNKDQSESAESENATIGSVNNKSRVPVVNVTRSGRPVILPRRFMDK